MFIFESELRFKLQSTDLALEGNDAQLNERIVQKKSKNSSRLLSDLQPVEWIKLN